MSATVNSDLFLWGTRTTAGAKKHLWNPVKSLVHMESRLHGLQDNGAQGLKTSVVTLWVVARAQGSSAGEIPQLSSQPQVPVWAVDDARVLTLFWPAHPCTHEYVRPATYTCTQAMGNRLLLSGLYIYYYLLHLFSALWLDPRTLGSLALYLHAAFPDYDLLPRLTVANTGHDVLVCCRKW